MRAMKNVSIPRQGLQGERWTIERGEGSMKAIRFAQEEDAGKILAIYEPYIKETAVTFEYRTPTLDEFSKRIRDISKDYPYLVCVSEESIIGYAYAHKHMEREAYQWNAELSVYINKNYFRCGIGGTLYGALMDILRLQNVRNVYGGVTLPNTSSEKLHEYLGFKKLGVYHDAGYKCGLWHNVAWYEKGINHHDLKPAPFVSFYKIDKETVLEILGRYSEYLNS